MIEIAGAILLAVLVLKLLANAGAVIEGCATPLVWALVLGAAVGLVLAVDRLGPAPLVAVLVLTAALAYWVRQNIDPDNRQPEESFRAWVGVASHAEMSDFFKPVRAAAEQIARAWPHDRHQRLVFHETPDSVGCTLRLLVSKKGRWEKYGPSATVRVKEDHAAPTRRLLLLVTTDLSLTVEEPIRWLGDRGPHSEFEQPTDAIERLLEWTGSVARCWAAGQATSGDDPEG